MLILQKLNERGMTVVLVTHEPDIASYCRRSVVFRDGQIVADTLNAQPLFAQEQLARLSERKEVEA
jgi:putative ABC transport system ATP-binding protein